MTFSEKCDFYEKIWNNMAVPTDDSIIRRMRTASWKPKATDTHLEYVILITFPMWAG